MRKVVLHNVETLFRGASKALLEDGEVAPTFIFMGEDGPQAIVAAGEDPMAHAPMIETVARATSVGLIFVAETWYVAQETPDMSVPPSQHPDRKEALMMLLFDDRGNSEMWMQPFERDENDGPIIVDDYHITDGSGVVFSKLNPWRDRQHKPEA